MKIILLVVLLAINCQSLTLAQTCDALVKEARSLTSMRKFDDAIKKVEAAKGCATPAEIDQLYKEVFSGLKKQTGEAERAEKKSSELLQQVGVEKQIAISEKEKSQASEQKAQEALLQVDIERKRALEVRDSLAYAEQKAVAVLEKIYFYEDRFGLSYDKSTRQYGFIDKKLNTKVRFKYDEARSFDPQGLAQVSKDLVTKNLEGKNLVQYLIDTSGNEYPLELRKGRIGHDTKAVDFSYANYFMIPRNVTRQDQLRVLRMNYCRLKVIPKRIGNLDALLYVQLRNNRIKEIHKNIGNLKNLQSFELSGNQITEIPLEIGDMVNLKVLNLNDNRIVALPDEIGKLKKLQFLSLNKNKLTVLPLQISKLENLRDLDLTGNRISELPAEIVQLKNLKTLNLTKNPCLVVYIKQLRESMPWCEIKFE